MHFPESWVAALPGIYTVGPCFGQREVGQHHCPRNAASLEHVSQTSGFRVPSGAMQDSSREHEIFRSKEKTKEGRYTIKKKRSLAPMFRVLAPADDYDGNQRCISNEARCTHNVPCIALHTSRFTHLASRIALHASRSTRRTLRTSHTSPFGLRLPASAAESPPAPPSSYAFSAARATRCSSSKRLWSAIRSTSFSKSRPHLPYTTGFSARDPQLLRAWFLGGVPARVRADFTRAECVTTLRRVRV